MVLNLARADTTEVAETYATDPRVETLVGRMLTRIRDLRRLPSVDASLSLNIAHKRENIVQTRAGVTVYFSFLGRSPRSDLKGLPWSCLSPTGLGTAVPTTNVDLKTPAVLPRFVTQARLSATKFRNCSA
jgi:hypothetical protein